MRTCIVQRLHDLADVAAPAQHPQWNCLVVTEVTAAHTAVTRVLQEFQSRPLSGKPSSSSSNSMCVALQTVRFIFKVALPMDL